MKILVCDRSGIFYRDATLDEIERFEQETQVDQPKQQPTVEDRVQILEEALELFLSGATS